MARRHRREGTSRNNPALKPPSLLPSLSRFTPCSPVPTQGHTSPWLWPQLCRLLARPCWLSHSHVSLTRLSRREAGQRSPPHHSSNTLRGGTSASPRPPRAVPTPCPASRDHSDLLKASGAKPPVPTEQEQLHHRSPSEGRQTHARMRRRQRPAGKCHRLAHRPVPDATKGGTPCSCPGDTEGPSPAPPCLQGPASPNLAASLLPPQLHCPCSLFLCPCQTRSYFCSRHPGFRSSGNPPAPPKAWGQRSRGSLAQRSHLRSPAPKAAPGPGSPRSAADPSPTHTEGCQH